MIANQSPTRLFSLGQIVATPACLHVISEAGQHPVEFLRRHVAGDWGDLCDEDMRLNDQAVGDGSRILSAYEIQGSQEKLYVITEADRSSTTLLMASEY